MKNTLVRLFVLILITLPFTSCNKCTGDDTKTGETSLMKESQSFIEQFVGKKVIFKDSVGHELAFKDTSGLIKVNEQLQTGITCQNNAPFRSLISYIGYKSFSIGLKNDVFAIKHTCRIISKNNTDTISIYDILDCRIEDAKTSYALYTVYVDLSKRGVSTRTNFWDSTFVVIADTILNQKKYSNLIRMDKSSLSLNVIESFLDKNKGLIAFKLNDGSLWTLDRIE